MPLTVALTVLFVGLKLGHIIAWSWVWVLSPLWVGVLAGFALAVLMAAVTSGTGTPSLPRRR